MSARSFRSVGWVAGIAATALGCYMVNLKVASERAALEDVETRIVLAQRDIRLLQTEIGTRGRLAQLEKWNVRVLALSAPAANQFVEGGFQLATLVAPKKVIDPAAPVVLASAPAPERKPVLNDDGAVATTAAAPADLMHVASLKSELGEDEIARPAPKLAPAPKKTVEKPAVEQSGAAKKPAKLAKKETESATAPATGKAAGTKPAGSASAKSVTAKPTPKAAPARTAATKPKPKEAKTEQ